jgi:hypothetical protein
MGPLIAVVGSASDAKKDELKLLNPEQARQAAMELGRELAKAGCRMIVYSSYPEFIEFDAVSGFVSAKPTSPGSIQVRYPLSCPQPPFPDQTGYEDLFDWRPDRSADWEVAFYRSLEEVDGMILIGGGGSTLIGGLVAMGRRLPMVALASFGGAGAKVWESLSVERDLTTREDISLMARPKWTSTSASECIQLLLAQRQRLQREREVRRLQELRQSGAVQRQALVAMLLFLLAIAAVPLAWGDASISYRLLLWLLFVSPLLGGVSGATSRMVFDWQQGKVPHTPQSAWITAALGLVAGGVSGLLFISAQLSALPADSTDVASKLQQAQASHLVPFALAIGFTAGLTLDAVFRKLTGMDVVHSEAVEVKSSSGH